MGMLLLPFLLAAAGVFVFAVTKLYPLVVHQQLPLSSFVYGLLIAVLLYGLILGRYIRKKRYWALSPFFTIPIFQFILPFVLALITRHGSHPFMSAFTQCLLLSIVYSGLFFVLSKNVTFTILDKLGIQKHY
jgi:drug/metabolite transporter (DMT)-like permease